MRFQHNLLRAIALFAMVLALAACQGAGAGTPAGDPLNGTKWQLASMNGAAAIPGATVTAEFMNGQINGSAGCNSYGGKYQVDGEKLHTSEIVSTLMACADPQGVMDQESAFLGALNNAQSFRITGDKLEITTSDEKTIAFDRQP